MMKYFKSSRGEYFRYDTNGLKTVEVHMDGNWLHTTCYVDEEDLIRCLGYTGNTVVSITEEEAIAYITMEELTT